MTKAGGWRPLSWHCENCGEILSAVANSQKEYKVTCRQCGTRHVKRIRSRNHTVTDSFAPGGLEIFSGELEI